MKTSGRGISEYGLSLSLQPEVPARSQRRGLGAGSSSQPARRQAERSRGMLPFPSFPSPPNKRCRDLAAAQTLDLPLRPALAAAAGAAGALEDTGGSGWRLSPRR